MKSGGDGARGSLVRRRDRILEIDDDHVGAGRKTLFELPLRIARNEQQRAHVRPAFFMIIAWRRHFATSTPFWLKARCSNSTMPRSGFDFDSRTD